MCVSPDPTGEQMQRLVPLLRTMVESCTKGPYDGGEDEKARVWGVVIDFMSLPQRGYTSGYVPDEMGLDGKVIKSNDDRTPYQLARFGGGLSAYTGFQPAPLTSRLQRHLHCLCSHRHFCRPLGRTFDLTFAEGINYWYAAPNVTTLVLDTPMPAGAENPAPVDSAGGVSSSEP